MVIYNDILSFINPFSRNFVKPDLIDCIIIYNVLILTCSCTCTCAHVHALPRDLPSYQVYCVHAAITSREFMSRNFYFISPCYTFAMGKRQCQPHRCESQRKFFCSWSTTHAMLFYSIEPRKCHLCHEYWVVQSQQRWHADAMHVKCKNHCSPDGLGVYWVIVSYCFINMDSNACLM